MTRKHMYHKPKYFRAPKNRVFGWEIYDLKSWFFTINLPFNISIEFDRWPEVRE